MFGAKYFHSKIDSPTKMKVLYTLVFLCFNICISYGKKLPSYITKCKRDDPGLSDCMKKAMEDFRVHMPAGVKEMRMPPTDPLFIERASLGLTFGKADLTKINLYKTHEFEIPYFKIDLDKNKVWMNLTFPYLELQSHYDIEAKISAFAIQGEGKFIANFTDTKMTVEVTGKTTEKKGEKYVHWEDVNLKILYDSLKYFDLENLFRNNPELTERFLTFARENQSDLTPEAIPLVEKIVSEIILSFFNGVFDTFSLNELYD